MQIFGVGPLELLLILVLALVIMGPQDMVGTARRMGRWVYQVVRSPTWRAIMETTQEFRDLPQKIVRDAGLDEAVKEIKDTANQVKSEMEATTREINSEMQAATNEISSELNSAALEVNHDLQQVTNSNELPAGVAPFAAEGTQASGESAAEAGSGLAEGQAAPAPSLDELNPDSILWPDLAPETQAAPESLALAEVAPAPVDPYVAGLGTIAMALGGQMKSPGALELAPAPLIPQTITPEMIASAPLEAVVEETPSVAAAEPEGDAEPEAPAAAPHPWAPGLALSGPTELDMQARFQAQMASMEKAFEELDARILAQAEEAPAAPAPIEELILPQEPSAEPEPDKNPVAAEAALSTEAAEAPSSAEEAVENATEELPPAAQEPGPESASDEKPADPQAAGFGAAEAALSDTGEEPSAG